MDIRKIRQLIKLLEETGVAEIEVQEGETFVRINRYGVQPAPAIYNVPPALPHTMETAVIAESKESKKALPKGHQIKSPMVGTLYVASAPGEKPFVEVGQRVKVGTVLCIVEAMKMLNQIEADREGVVIARLVENGQPIEFDQPLFVIE